MPVATEKLLLPAQNYLQNGDGDDGTPDVSPRSRALNQTTIETPSYTFTLPNITCQQPRQFQLFLEKELIETSTLKGLQQSGHLNWWVDGCSSQASSSSSSRPPLLDTLWPLSTSGDGNCLLHAASLGMWGFHDRLLILRKALHELLSSGSRRHALWRRWRFQQSLYNQQIGLKFDESEWRREWQSLVQLASPEPRSKLRRRVNNQQPQQADETKPGSGDDSSPPANGQQQVDDAVAGVEYEPVDDVSFFNWIQFIARDATTYESLEEIHVFTLAHVLKRPIFVVADTVLRGATGDPLAPIPFGGIYLPLECSPKDTHRSPLVLCYDAAHFSALVTMQPTPAHTGKRQAVIPITNGWRELLPVHFASDPGPDFTWWSDEQDSRLAHKAALTDEQKLELIGRYTDLIKVECGPSAVPKSRTLPSVNNAAAASPAHNSGQQQTLRSATGSLRQPPSTTTLASPLHRALHRLHRRSASLRRGVSPDRPATSNGSTSSWSQLRRLLHPASKSSTVPKRSVDSSSQLASSCSEHAVQQQAAGIVSLRDVWSSGCVVGAQLHTGTHHQYMNDMVNSYLASARKRFDGAPQQQSRTGSTATSANNSQSTTSRWQAVNNNNNYTTTTTTNNTSSSLSSTSNSAAAGQPTQSSAAAAAVAHCNGAATEAAVNGAGDTTDGKAQQHARQPSADLDTRRARCISRSLSAASMQFTCMNGHCAQPSSHETNFLCVDCFHSQREMMASFSPAVHPPANVSPPRSPVKHQQQTDSVLNGNVTTQSACARGQCYSWQQHFDCNLNPSHPATTNGSSPPSPSTTATSNTTTTTAVTVRTTGQAHHPSSQHNNQQQQQQPVVRIGVNAVTNTRGVTHYFIPNNSNDGVVVDQMMDNAVIGDASFCRSPHCANYSNGHKALCHGCAKRQQQHPTHPTTTVVGTGDAAVA